METEVLSIRLPLGTKDLLRVQAQKHGMTLTEYAERLLSGKRRKRKRGNPEFGKYWRGRPHKA